MKQLGNILLLVAAVIIYFISIKTCQNPYSSQQETIDSLMLANQRLDSIVNKQGQTIYTQQSIVTGNQASIKKLTDSIFQLKAKDRRNREVIAFYQGRTTTEIDTLGIAWVDTLSMKRFEDSIEKRCKDVITFYRDSTLQVPFTQAYSTDDLSLSVTVKKTGLTINKLSIVDTLNLRFVEKRGFLKRKQIEVQYFHSSPYVKVTGSNSVTYKPKKKKRVLEKALLIGAGIFLGSKL